MQLVLLSVPSRQERRRERAHRPHLRERTPAAGPVQLVLFRPRSRTDLLSPEKAEAMEDAVRAAKAHREGSPRQRAAESLLLELLTPFLRQEMHRAWAGRGTATVLQEDLLQEAQVHALKLWRGFTVGYAGPGRTLYPAYVMKAVRQHLQEVLADAAPVHVTSHGRKLHARARKLATNEGVELREALEAEGADDSTTLALVTGAQRVADSEALPLADEDGEERRGELALQAHAVAVLKRLPLRQRLAVATPLGLTGQELPDAQLARKLKCSLDELLEAREEGLLALREALSEDMACR